jgi:hypothetical protein
MSLQDEVLQPDWYGERREDRTKYSVSQSQPAQGSTGPPSKLEYVGSYVVGGAKPYGDDEMTRPVIWTEPTRSAGMNNQVQPGPERQPPQSQPVVVESWQQTQVNPSAVRTYYEGDIKPGQNVVMPGFTISIEAPRHSGGQIAGPKPIVTITPADSDTHVMTVTQPGEWQVPSITTIRTPGSSQQHHDAQIVPQSDWYAQRQQQYNQKTAEFQHQPVTEFRQVTNATQQEMATDRQWQYKPTPLMTTDDDGAWYKPADVRVETQRSRLENVGSDWNEAVMQKPSYGSSEPVGNITVTVGDRPHFIYKPELPQVISLPKVTQHDPKFVEEQYGFSQQTLPIQHQNNTLPSQSLQNHGLDQEHTVSKIQQPVFGEDVVYPYSPPARMEKSHSWSGQQIPSFAQPLPSQPMTSQYPGQGTLQHSQPTDQGSYACPPSAYPASSLQSPTNSSDYYLSNSSHPDLKRSSSYTAGFPPPHQGQSYPPVTPYSTVSKDPYSPQYRPPSQTDSYQNEPQTAPVKSTFKLPLNPNFNKALFGGEVTNEQTAPSNQTYFGQDNKFSAQQQQQQQQDGGHNSQTSSSSIQPPYDSAYRGPKVWSPPPVQGQNPQMNPWQAGGQTAWGYGDQMMNDAAADVGGYYNAVPTAVNQMPPNMMPPPPPLAPAPPPPPLPPPPPENPLKVYGITTSSSDPERKNLESKVKLANSVAHAVLSPENVNSRGQKMFLRRRQNSHKWTTSGPDPTSTNDDTRQQPMSPPSWSGQRPQPSFASQSQPQSTMMPRHPPPGQGLSRSPQPERRNPIQEYGVDRGGKGGAMFAKLQQRSESAGSLQSAGITDRSALPLQSYPTQFQGKNLGGSGAAVQQMRSWAGQQSPHGMNQYRPPPPTVMVTNHQFGISDL